VKERPTVKEVQKRLSEFDWSTKVEPGKNKGRRGQLIETALGVPNSSALVDLADGELKTFTVGQSIACTQLKHCLSDIVEEVSFEDSKLGIKMNQVIYVGFSKDHAFCGAVTFNHDSNPEHYASLKQDYDQLCCLIKLTIQEKGKLQTITGDNQLLQIRTKASPKPMRKAELQAALEVLRIDTEGLCTADLKKKLSDATEGQPSKTPTLYSPLTYKGHELKDKGMAFYLCGAFGRTLFPM
jgi:hypothetical protein